MHTNIYGPQASGKTRYANEFRAHYACSRIIDEGKVIAGKVDVPSRGKVLLLTIEPIRHPTVVNVPIETALKAIGKKPLIRNKGR
jgi:hypothetical protein